MFYYLYEIKNNLNGKIYVGVHKTQDISDGYMGSGKVITAAIAKYGVENFTKSILETFENAEDMYAREKEVVNAEFLLREDTYNLRCGGQGGFDFINSTMHYKMQEIRRSNAKKMSYELRRANGIKTGAINRQKWRDDPSSRPVVFTPEFNLKMSNRARTDKANNKRKETFSTIGHQQGEKNSQFGSRWITDGINNKKIMKNIVVPDGWWYGTTKRAK